MVSASHLPTTSTGTTMSLTALPPHTAHTVTSKPPAVFEFTKRKKWADILISELSGSVLLILNNESNLLWASPAVTELLGWRDDELVEHPIREFLHDDDAAPFAEHLKRAIASRSELFTYVRLRPKFASPRPQSRPDSPRSPTTNTAGSSTVPASSTPFSLFELRGHAIYSKGSMNTPSDPGPSVASSSSSRNDATSEPGASCFVIMARPYPSRNTAMLDSFLELKIENERLRQQLLNLRTAPSSPTQASPAYPINQIAPVSESPHGQASTLSSPVYPTTNLGGLNLSGNVSGDADAAYQPKSIHAMPQPPSAYYPTQGNRFAGAMDVYPSTSFGAGPSPAVHSARRGSIVEEPAAAETTETGRTRKKPKKAHTTQEQYVCVTCGRTDSPEWRKGPLGAKTLCNACGLRWAKRNTKRKTDEFAGTEAGGGGG